MILKARFSYFDIVVVSLGAVAFNHGDYLAAFLIAIAGGVLSGFLASKFPPA